VQGRTAREEAMALTDKLKDKGYAVFWALAGVARPRALAAFIRARRQADREWQESHPVALTELGSVAHLSILPLVDLYPGGEGLVGEPGVSYLITTDGKKILFDTGLNRRQEHPSPLLRNMNRLGVSVADVDAVFISHLHLDHVGGPKQMRERTFALSGQPVELRGIPAYVPAPMTHPSADVEVVTEPRALAAGVASSGPLTRAIWWMGPVGEHTLLVNVAGKGVVMIVGCGHPSLERLVARAQAVTGMPLYGVIGGLHFPVTCSRVGKGGQTIIGNGKLPWQRITRREAREEAARLAGFDLGLVALSAHDSCDWALDTFKNTLGNRFRTIRVGEEIVVA
jgi:7,8-dihydropterin-6-yl-methyl-4-(beta-D-ribofuranosyl)aminobenzene 5'-phosphate synthase